MKVPNKEYVNDKAEGWVKLESIKADKNEEASLELKYFGVKKNKKVK